MRSARPGVQDRAAIAKAGDAPTVEQVGIDSGHLRGTVCAQAQHAPGELIDQFEGLQVERTGSTAEQGFEMLEQRRYDQFIAIATRHVQQFPAKFFDVPRLGRQDIGNVIRQDPGGHE